MLELAALDPLKQPSADPAALKLGRDRDQRSAPADHGIGCDPAIELDHPRVGGQVEVVRAPFVEQFAERRVGLVAIGDIARHQHGHDCPGVIGAGARKCIRHV